MTDVRTHDPVHGADDRPWLHHLDVALIVAVSAIGAALAGPASDLVRAGDPRAGEPTPIVLALSDLVFTLCHAVPVIGMVALMAFAVRHLDARALRLGPPPRVAVTRAHEMAPMPDEVASASSAPSSTVPVVVTVTTTRWALPWAGRALSDAAAQRTYASKNAVAD